MIDLSHIKVVDFHAHVPWKSSVTDLIDSWSKGSLRLVMPTHEYEKLQEAKRTNDEDMLNTLVEKYGLIHWTTRFREQIGSLSYIRGIIKYIANSYGCDPNLEQVDAVVLKKAEDNLVEYIRSILNRENVETVVLNVAPGVEIKDFPKNRYNLCVSTTDLIQPDWAKNKNAENIDEVLDLINIELDDYVKRGCVGFKNLIGYYRKLGIEKVDTSEANRAYKSLLKTKPVRYTNPMVLGPSTADHLLVGEFPIYQAPEDIRNFKLYNDFLLRHLMIRSGELDIPYIFHTGGSSNPTDLIPTLSDDDIKKTKIVLLHASSPHYRAAASMARLFPNLYVDISWQMGTPYTFHHIMKTFLDTSISQKFLYGSDETTLAERLGFCVSSAKKVMTLTFDEFIKKYDWTEAECLEAAENIFYKNSKKLLNI